jgi:hypothetical protein
MTPSDDTATNNPSPYVTELQALLAAEVCEVHVMPSGLVITPLEVPEKPTATKSPSPYVTLLQLLAAAAVRPVHVIPSELVQMVDGPPPVATKYDPFQAIPRALLVGLFRTGNQLEES